MSEALCVTALGPAALCDAVLDAVGRLFDAEWASLVLTSGDLPSSVPSQVTWYREPGQRAGRPLGGGFGRPRRADHELRRK